MNNNRWRSVERIFDETLELPEADRAAFIAQACDGDRTLQQEVESLLAAHYEAESFLVASTAKISPVALLNHLTPATAGQHIGPYQLLREIAQGGMGTVWLAERADDQFKQQVAIKLLKTHSPDIAGRLRHERQILADLNYPNIARLLDGGTTESGQPYLVMEYIEGVPIDAYCQQQQLGLRERLQLFRQVCAAVQYAHQHLIIHRDLKPANILVTADGTPKLLDFGIAKLLQPDLSQSYQTQAGQTPMTPAYASPEQVRGEKLATTSDVYSLGVLLYELLTGRSPYQLTTNTYNEMMRAICEQEPTRPSTAGMKDEGGGMNQNKQLSSLIPHPSSLRGDLDSIVLMVLRKEPSARYSSVEQFSADIQRYLDGLPTLARKGTLGYRAVKYVRRYKVPVAAAALILLSLVGGIGATSRQAQIARAEQAKAEANRIRAEQALAVADEQRRLAEQALAEVEAQRTRAENALTTAEQRRQQAEAARNEANQQRAAAEVQRLAAEAERNVAQTQRQRAETQELSNRQLLYTSRMGLAMQAWDDANIRRMREMLNYYLPQSGEPDYRGFEWFHLWKLAHGELRTLSVVGTAKEIAYTKDGQQLMTVMQNGPFTTGVTEVSIHETATWQLQHKLVLPLATLSSFSADRQSLALARLGGQEITVISLPRGTEMHKINGLRGGISCLAFVPDGRRLAIGFYDGSMGVLDLPTGKEQYRSKGHLQRVFTVAVSPDGQKMVSGSDDTYVKLWDVNAGKEILTLGKSGHLAQSSLFSPDGQIVAVSGSGLTRIWDVLSGKELASLAHLGRRMAFSPDGKTLVIGGEDARNMTELYFVETNTWQETGRLKGHGNMIMALGFSPDGEQLVSGGSDQTVKLWGLNQNSAVTTINDQPRKWGEFTTVVITPDGRRIITGQLNQSATIWDALTGKEIITLKGHVEPANVTLWDFVVAVSPDGRWYATGGGDAQVKIWDAITGKEYRSFQTQSIIRSLAFSPNSETIAVGNAGIVSLWEINSGQKLSNFTGIPGTVRTMQFKRGGNYLFTAGPDEFVRLWDISTGQLQQMFHCRTNIWSFALFPDEASFVTGESDGTARIWDAQTGQERVFLKGHTSVVSAVAVSPDGKRVVTGSYDKTVRVWDRSTAQELIVLKGHTAWLCRNSIGFSADGRLLMTAAMDRVAKLWQAATEQAVLGQTR